MGWTNDSSPGHEGYLVGIVPATNPDGTTSDWRFRELWTGDDPGTGHTIPLHHVQVGCECGWRSPRLDAPSGTCWFPSIVDAPAWFEERSRRLWRQHIALLNEHASNEGDLGTSAVLDAVHRAAPNHQLAVLTLLEHPRLLDAVDVMLSELQEGLR